MGNSSGNCYTEQPTEHIDILSKTPALHKPIARSEVTVQTKNDFESFPNEGYWDTGQHVKEVKIEQLEVQVEEEFEKEVEREVQAPLPQIHKKVPQASKDYTPFVSGKFIQGKLFGYGTMQYENGNVYQGKTRDHSRKFGFNWTQVNFKMENQMASAK